MSFQSDIESAFLYLSYFLKHFFYDPTIEEITIIGNAKRKLITVGDYIVNQS